MTKIRVVGMEGAPKGPLGNRDFCHCDPSLNAYFCSYTLFILGADFLKGYFSSLIGQHRKYQIPE